MDNKEELTTQYNGFTTEYISLRVVVVGKRKYLVVPEQLQLNIVKEGGDFIEIINKSTE